MKKGDLYRTSSNLDVVLLSYLPVTEKDLLIFAGSANKSNYLTFLKLRNGELINFYRNEVVKI